MLATSARPLPPNGKRQHETNPPASWRGEAKLYPRGALADTPQTKWPTSLVGWEFHMTGVTRPPPLPSCTCTVAVRHDAQGQRQGHARLPPNLPCAAAGHSTGSCRALGKGRVLLQHAAALSLDTQHCKQWHGKVRWNSGAQSGLLITVLLIRYEL